jgi:uncharacterized DUF497 family protein
MSVYTDCKAETDVLLALVNGFAWDAGNANRSWPKHRVSRLECEQVFFGKPLLVVEDPLHSQAERRFVALGRTREQWGLLVAFTVRGERIRVISARPMSRKERKAYDEAQAGREAGEVGA